MYLIICEKESINAGIYWRTIKAQCDNLAQAQEKLKNFPDTQYHQYSIKESKNYDTYVYQLRPTREDLPKYIYFITPLNVLAFAKLLKEQPNLVESMERFRPDFTSNMIVYPDTFHEESDGTWSGDAFTREAKYIF